MPAAQKNHPFRHAVFLLAVRNRLIRELMARDGQSRAEAFDSVHALTDDIIEEAAMKVTGTAPAVGGKVLDGILSFLTSPEFLKLVVLLLSLFGVTATDLAPPA